MAETFANAKARLTNTTETDVLGAVPASTTRIVLSVLACNTIDTASSVDCTLKITNSSNTSLAELAHTIPIPADSALELVSSKLVLTTGDKLRAISNNASGFLDFAVSYLDIT